MVILQLLLILSIIISGLFGDESIDSDHSVDHSHSTGCGCASLGRNALTSDYTDLYNDYELEVITENTILQPINPLEDLVFIEGGSFLMGTNNPILLSDGESPRRQVTVSSFYIDKYEVSNDKYLEFVKSTNYTTESELFGWSFVFESAIPNHIKKDITEAVYGAEWWLPVNGSYWREPEGPGTDVFKTNRGNLPAVHISWHDAKRFCEWKGGRLPTEAEWEYAARGGKEGLMYPWGNTLKPKGEHKANIFQGTFPQPNIAEDGYEFLCPVDAFGPQNDFGLYNMIGNAWEWVEDWYTVKHITSPQVNPVGPLFGKEKAKKGGSFLCIKSFCYRYRTAARYHSTPDSATLNTGFRCVRDVDVKSNDFIDEL